MIEVLEIGSIVYHDEIIFKDGAIDIKDRRPCVVIYNDTEKQIVYTMPITSNERRFNEKPHLYTFISQAIYDYKKLSFVKVNHILVNNYSTTHDTGIVLDRKDVIRVLKKASKLNSNIDHYDRIYKTLNSLSEEKAKQKAKIYKKNRTTNNQ